MTSNTFVFFFFTRAKLAYLFLITKNPKIIFFGNCIGPFTPKVKLIGLRLKEVPLSLHFTPDLRCNADILL